MTPSARSKQLLESDGWLVDVVERRITRMVTKDLFGCFDLLAVRERETLAVQVTTAPNMSARRRKLHSSEHLSRIFSAGWRIELHGWKKSRRRWQVKRENLEEAKAAIAE